jgi:hypothetical protein
MRITYIYVGAGWDTVPFTTRGTNIHCIDGQPHSEFGTRTSFDTNGSNVYSRPKFAKRVLRAYERAGFKCSKTDRTKILETGLLNGDNFTGERTVIVFVNPERDITIWYHFNSGLPEHADEIYKMVQGTPCYNGILCAGHWPHVSIIDKFAVPDNSLVFHGYPRTAYHVEDRRTIEQSVVGRLSYDDAYRKKFTHFVFHDLNGGENTFDCWDDYLGWICENPDLAYE